MTKVILICLCFGLGKSSWVDRKQLKTEQSAVQGGLATLQKSVDHFVDIDRSRFVCKVGCIFLMAVISTFPHVEFGRNGHREDAPQFRTFFDMTVVFSRYRNYD